MKRWLLVTGLGLAALAVSACGGGGGGAGGGAVPLPGPTCGTSALQAQLVYPAPGSTGVSDNLPEVVVATNTPLPNATWNLALYVNGALIGQTAEYFGQISQSQLPAGSANTTISNPTYEQVNLSSNLGSQITYQTALNIPLDPNNCTPFIVPGGTFTTQ